MNNNTFGNGTFLLKELLLEAVFSPEDFSLEQKSIASAVRDFTLNEVLPREIEMENKNYATFRALLRQFAEMGYLGIEIPEEFGGAEMDMTSSAIVTENLAASSYFITTCAAHIGIGTLPIKYFGTAEQKAKYLPLLSSAQIIGAYALTEPGAGSDAAAIRTSAKLTEDGQHYIIDGTKIWITNAGLADLFTVFTKIDNDPRKITCFLVERETPGFTIGNEEHKMGLRGSSTCQLNFSNAKVPATNMLGQIGDGFKIAMNILNLGRLKLAFGCIGGAKHLLRFIGNYANERKAFGQPIGSFGLIQEKFAKMLTRLWLAESMAYRTVGELDLAIQSKPSTTSEEVMKIVAGFAAECALNKVFASNMLAFVADESVQTHGGMGFEDSEPTARAYRDERVNRIFEGTNEINRLLAAGSILKSDKINGGQIPLFEMAKKYSESLIFGKTNISDTWTRPMGEEWAAIVNLKKLVVMLYGASAQRFLKELPKEQEILGALADMTADVLALESALVRNAKTSDGTRKQLFASLLKIAIKEANDSISSKAATIAYRIATVSAAREQLPAYLSLIKRLTKNSSTDAIELQRLVADKFLKGEWKI